jgi:hypothetical protein
MSTTLPQGVIDELELWTLWAYGLGLLERMARYLEEH